MDKHWDMIEDEEACDVQVAMLVCVCERERDRASMRQALGCD